MICKKEVALFYMQVHGIAVVDDWIYTTLGTKGLVRWSESGSKKQEYLISKGFDMKGIVYDGKDTLYICDQDNNKILSISIYDHKISILTGRGNYGHKDGSLEDATFCNPRDITMDKNGYLYVCEWGIRKIDLVKKIVTTILGEDCGYFAFCGITMKDDTIYVCDHRINCILKVIDGVASIITGFHREYGYQDGTLKDARFGFPRSLCLDNDRNLIVMDDSGIRKINIDRNEVSTIFKLANVTHLSISSAKGNIYFSQTASGNSTSIYVMWDSWLRERLLWIGKLKENNCFLIKLPTEIIKEIALYLKY